MAQVQLITGVERRRRWSEEQKRQIVEAAFASGSNVSEVARRADLHNSVIYKWRRELQPAVAGFAKVAVIESGAGSVERCGAGIDIALGNGAHIRIPGSIPPDLAAAVIKTLVRR
jgi:transposase